MTVILDDFEPMFLADDRYLDWSVVGRDGQDLATLTATVSVYDSSGNALITGAAATVAGTTIRPIVSYLLLTGAGHSITVAGRYRTVMTATCLGEVCSFQSTLNVMARPA